MPPSHAENESPLDGRAALGAVLFSLLLHAFAGWADERRIVVRPGGHLRVFVLAAWVFTGGVSLIAFVIARRWRVLAGLCTGVAAIAIAVLLR